MRATNTGTAAEHVLEMESRGFAAFRLFSIAAELDGPDEREQAYSILRKIVDVLMSNGLEKKKSLVEPLVEISKRRRESAMEMLDAVNSALQRVSGSKKQVSGILRGLQDWIVPLPDSSLHGFLRWFPVVAPGLAGLNSREYERVTKFIDQQSDSDRLLDWSLVWACGGSHVLLGALNTVSTLIALDSTSVLLENPNAGALARRSNQTDAQSTIKMMGEMCCCFRKREPELISAIIQLILQVSAQSLGSGYLTAERLPSALGIVPEEAQLMYIGDFLALYEAIGPSATGHCVSVLPRHYERLGADIAHAFAQEAAEAGRRYGRIAGEWYLEARTAASRGMLMRVSGRA